MKRMFTLLLCFTILLASCSNATGNRWEPQVATAKIEPYAKQAISIIDQYLDFEIDIKAAKEGFHEVLSRIDVTDYEIFSPEQTVYSTIMDVCLDAEDLTDTDFRMYRDILCFQIGEPVSGDAYTPTTEFNNDSSVVTYIAKTLDLEAYPAKSIWISDFGDDDYYVSLTFDVMNGISPEAVCQWCLDIMDAVKQSGAKVSTVYTDYEIYGQASFTMSSSCLATSGENLIVLYDHESNTLADSDSKTDVDAIIEIAKEYVKTYAE